MINKTILPLATVLVLSSSISSFADETKIENKNLINKIGVVTAKEGLNIRKTPKVENGNKLFAIEYNAKVQVLNIENAWYKVKVNNKEGWASSQYISITNSNIKEDVTYKYVSGNRVNFRQGPNTSSTVYNVLNKGEKVKFISKQGSWSKIEYNNKIGYIHSDYLSDKNQSSLENSSTSLSIDAKRKKIVSMAKAQIGKPYEWGAEGPNSFDCSGLITYIYKNAVGMRLPRTSTQQSTFGTTISKSNLKEGDLIFASTNGTGRVSHVGIYIGNGEMIHSPKPGDVVKKTNINISYWSNAYLWSKRVL